ncbi:MAG TPA: lipoyl(octanoyl) transferase LipB [Segetibacter sp.]|jgi:lipoyl(octanoyl) transferase
MKQTVVFRDLGQDRPYKEIWDLQEHILQQNVQIKANNRTAAESGNAQPAVLNIERDKLSANLHEPGIGNQNGLQQAAPNPTSPVFVSTTNHLLFVEHTPVYTLGKSGDISHVLISEEELKKKGIEFFKINRGGDITFHGPGQLTGYPILDLDNFKTDLGWYLRSLEEVIILTMAEYGLKGERSIGETGVWLEPGIPGNERKICAMGIRCSRWITMHGFALNINTDLGFFDYIIPCGIKNKRVTSLQKELGQAVPMTEVKEKVRNNLEKVFGVSLTF